MSKLSPIMISQYDFISRVQREQNHYRAEDVDARISNLERQLAELWNHYNDVEEMYWHTFDMAVGSATTVDRKNLAIMRLKKLISTLREENQEMEILYNYKCAQLNKFVLLS